MGGWISKMMSSPSPSRSSQESESDVRIHILSADVIPLERTDRVHGHEFVSSTDSMSHPLAWAAIQQYFPEGEFNDQQNRIAANYLIHQLRHQYGDIRDINLFALCSGDGRSEAYFLARLRDEGIRVNQFFTFDNLYTNNGANFTARIEAFDLADQSKAFSSAAECRDYLAKEKIQNDLSPIHATVSVHQQFAFFGEHAIEKIQELNSMLFEIEDARPVSKEAMPFFSFYCDRDWRPASPDSARLLSQQHGVYVENRNLVDGALRNATMARSAAVI
jgi:hypothetical protein